ncbi:unnamed protein product [Allacma fusca]|uniref:Arylamine N-acetyltransferase n=1 Tax=Allacma fusca TaxID=39272 RepID=A0A8J2PFL1_9HEXA|nr:unnamed protein product [Allacma fusca]
MLSGDKIEKFIEERLGIRDWAEQLEKSKLEFLTVLYRRYRLVMYFENTFMGTNPPEEQRGPKMSDVVYRATETAGGVCMHLNFFMNILLTHLGYNVHPIGAKCLSLDLPNNHIFLLVRFSNPGEAGNTDKYLVDVGFPWPISGPINLQQLPYEYNAGGFKIRYEFNEELSVYERVLTGGDPINREYDDKNEEKVDMRFDLEPRKFEDFGDTMEVIFGDADRSFFLNTTLMFRYVTLEDENNYEYICCMGRKIIFGSAMRREIQTYETYVEMAPDILKHFPQLKPDVVLKACELFDSKH